MVENAAHLIPFHAFIEARGVTIPFDECVITPNILEALLSGRFEAEESEQIPSIVRPGDRVLELGAGIGFISTLLSRCPEVERVIAVEANPQLMDFMAWVHAENGASKVERRNAVLTNEACRSVSFYLRDDFWMGSLMPEPNPYHSTIEVPTLSLNELLRDEDISLIVCDVEGAEATLFDDADLSRVGRVFLELHDHVTGLLRVGHIFRVLAEKGFIYDPRHSNGSVVLFRKVGPEDLVRPYAG
jgi:FkbM family methyltransferase